MIVSLHIVLASISLAVLLLAAYMRGSKRSLYMIYSFLAILLFNLGFLVEISAPVMEVSIIGKQIKYLGLPFISPFVLLFILDYYGYRVTTAKAAALFVVPVLHSLIAITFPWNGLFYLSTAWITDISTPYLKTEKSIIYYIGFFYSYLVTMSILVIALFSSRGKDYATRKQSNLIIASAAIPGMGNAINVLAPLNLPFDPTALLLTTGCTLLAYSFLRLNLFQIAPIAREQIIENIRDAFVLVDRHKCFIDANAAAKKLFPQLAHAMIGIPIDDIGDLPFPDGQDNMNNRSFEITDESGALRYYTISKTIIYRQHEFICNCLMIYDVTESKKLLDHVSNLAERDTLTGLINRGTLFSRGERLFQEIASAGGDMSALMIDVDHFKKINDTYGHQIGDEVLTIIAQKLYGRFRSTDIFARYGGEEFCALLPGTDEISAIQIAHELCKITECIDWEENKLPVLGITISIGIAAYVAEYHDTLDTLIGCADTALYAAKDAGRNTICNHNRIIHMGQLRLFG